MYLIYPGPRWWRRKLERLLSRAEGWLFKSQPGQTQVLKTGSNSSTAKHLGTDVSITIPWR